MDFMNWLDLDMSVKLLMHLKDPSDLARVSSVSRSWRDFGELKHVTFVHFCFLKYYSS